MPESRIHSPASLARVSRCLTRKQAADLLGLTPSGFSDWVRRRIVPGPIPGTHRWDRKAIDAALDKLGGFTPQSEDEDPFDAWRRQHEGADARG